MAKQSSWDQDLINLGINKTIIEIGSININGLADLNRWYKLIQYIVSQEIDLIFVQEIKQLVPINANNHVKILYKADDGRRNGVGIFYNSNRFEIQDQIMTDQYQIIDMKETETDTKFVAINLYLNPSPDKHENNIEIIDKLKVALENAMVAKTKVVLGGDLNQYSSEVRTMVKMYGIETSKVGNTRVEGRKEIDILASNLFPREFFKEHDSSFMSDHYILRSKITFCGIQKKHKVKKYTKSEIVKENSWSEKLSKIIGECETWGRIRTEIGKGIKEQVVQYGYNRKYVNIWKKVLKNEIPIISLHNKIKQVIGSWDGDLKNLWSLAKSFNGDLSKKESFFLQGTQGQNS